MDVSLSVAIVHASHAPERYRYVRWIKSVYPHAPISLDSTRAGVWPTCRKALRMIDRGATHHLVIQDDAILCRDFRRHVLDVISAVPDQVLSLMTSRKALIEKATSEGVHWGVSRDALHGIAMLFPVDMIDDFLGWERANVQPDFWSDDLRVIGYLQATGRDVWHPLPSLIQHACPKESLLGTPRKEGEGISPYFLDDVPQPIDWSLGVDRPVDGGGWKQPRSSKMLIR